MDRSGLRRVCAWCKTVLSEGAPGAEISHTICIPCLRAHCGEHGHQVADELERRQALREVNA